jgi:hypothetical protein
VQARSYSLFIKGASSAGQTAACGCSRCSHGVENQCCWCRLLHSFALTCCCEADHDGVWTQHVWYNKQQVRLLGQFCCCICPVQHTQGCDTTFPAATVGPVSTCADVLIGVCPNC